MLLGEVEDVFETPAKLLLTDLSIRPDTPSGPVTLLVSILLKVDLTCEWMDDIK